MPISIKDNMSRLLLQPERALTLAPNEAEGSGMVGAHSELSGAAGGSH